MCRRNLTMAKATPIEKFADALQDILTQYAEDVQKGMQEAIDEVGKSAATAVKQNAKQAVHSKKYHSGWTYTAEHDRTGALGHVHNRTEYQLAHLLEKGHVTRNGTGRTFRPTPAHPHIQEVDDMVADTVERKIIQVIK